MGTNQTRPAQRIDYTDPQRDTSGQDTGSSLDTVLPSVLVSNDHMDTVLADDVGVSAARISNMTANDKLHSILEYVRGGGSITPPAGGELPVHVEAAASPTNEVRDFGTVWLNTTTQQVYQTSGDGTWDLLIDFA